MHYEIDHLAIIHENFFNENSGSLKGLNCHEISFYFRMKSRGTKELHSNSTVYGVKEEMHWIPIHDLDKYKAFPSFMKDYLGKEHSGIEHIITDEGENYRAAHSALQTGCNIYESSQSRFNGNISMDGREIQHHFCRIPRGDEQIVLSMGNSLFGGELPGSSSF